MSLDIVYFIRHSLRPSPFVIMFAVLSIFLLALVSLAFAQGTPGTISEPAPYTVVAPGGVFNFSYNIHADYCKSSYAFAVYVVTESPVSMSPADQFMSGYYFGRYEAENYPGGLYRYLSASHTHALATAVPYPQNPAPPNLTMPNFDLPQGGFGGGNEASNSTFWVMVLEEWDDCEVCLHDCIHQLSSRVTHCSSGNDRSKDCYGCKPGDLQRHHVFLKPLTNSLCERRERTTLTVGHTALYVRTRFVPRTLLPDF